MTTPITVPAHIVAQLDATHRVVIHEGHSDHSATTSAPNDSDTCTHTVRTYVRIYAAAHYGVPRIYAEGSTTYFSESTGDAVADPYSGWSDGHPDRVRGRALRLGLDLDTGELSPA